MRSVVVWVDTVCTLEPAVVVVAPDMVDIAEAALVEVVVVEFGTVDNFAVEFGMVEVVAVEFGKTDFVEAVVARTGKIGTVAVGRRRLAVLWLLSDTVVQLVIGFLNSHSCLGWSNYFVGYSNHQPVVIDWMSKLLETCSHWWVDRLTHSTTQRGPHPWQNSSCQASLSNLLSYIQQRE